MLCSALCRPISRVYSMRRANTFNKSSSRLSINFRKAQSRLLYSGEISILLRYSSLPQNSPNSCMGSCCAASLHASSGFGCASTINPCMPKSKALCATSGTKSRRPAMWLGSQITGKSGTMPFSCSGISQRAAFR